MLGFRAHSRPLRSVISDSCLPSSGLSGPLSSYKIRTFISPPPTMWQLSLTSAFFSSFSRLKSQPRLPACRRLCCKAEKYCFTVGGDTARKHSVSCWGKTSVLLYLNPEDTTPLNRSLGSWVERKGRTQLFQDWELILKDTSLFQKELKTEHRDSWTKIFMIWRMQDVFSYLFTYL